MGCVYLNGVPYGDEPYVFRPAPAPVLDVTAIKADMDRRVAKMMADRLTDRAAVMAIRPALLEALYPGLSYADPVKLVAVASSLLEAELRKPRRHIGFGGEIPLINFKAALLLGRARRLYERGAVKAVA